MSGHITAAKVTNVTHSSENLKALVKGWEGITPGVCEQGVSAPSFPLVPTALGIAWLVDGTPLVFSHLSFINIMLCAVMLS